jgi:hypothetical protein
VIHPFQPIQPSYLVLNMKVAADMATGMWQNLLGIAGQDRELGIRYYCYMQEDCSREAEGVMGVRIEIAVVLAAVPDAPMSSRAFRG